MSQSKTDSRERAVLLLFEADSKNQPVSDVVANLDDAPDKYTATLLEAFGEHGEKVNALISQYSKGWSRERLPSFDRAVLRMSITELVRSADVPVGTIISEAVQLCEQYSTPESPRYVNGVLGTVAHHVRGVELLKKHTLADDSQLPSIDENS